jgi:hypothetical protein
MTSKAVLPTLVVVLISALIPAIGTAQHMGLQIGIAQPQAAPAASIQAPVIAVRNTLGIPTIISRPALVPAFPTVIVQNRVLVPGQTIVPAMPVPQGSPVAPPLRHRRPAPGTPRADVIQQFGPPSVTIITSSGETLYFTGGVTVIIQNGQVAGPR